VGDDHPGEVEAVMYIPDKPVDRPAYDRIKARCRLIE
jgi:hypothetical protein